MSKAKRPTPYDDLAWFYDRYWGSSFPEQARPGFQHALLPHLPAGGRILDLCCGTGQLAHWLTVCGFRVTGLDVSLPMIGHARRNAPQATFFVADARVFHTTAVFDAVVSTFDSVNHILDATDLAQAFSNVWETLVPDGLFFFDVNLDEGFRYSGDETYAVVQKDHVCVAQSDYDANTKLGTTGITLFYPSGTGWKRFETEIVEVCYSEEVLRAALAEAGFSDVVTFDAEADFNMPNCVGRRFLLAAKGQVPADRSARKKRRA